MCDDECDVRERDCMCGGDDECDVRERDGMCGGECVMMSVM